jgi:hypothetical protein
MTCNGPPETTFDRPLTASRVLDVGVAGELLDGAEIGAGIEHIADERPPQVMR